VPPPSGGLEGCSLGAEASPFEAQRFALSTSG
jgi:hypothetical protein